jgi:hypothetical protein
MTRSAQVGYLVGIGLVVAAVLIAQRAWNHLVPTPRYWWPGVVAVVLYAAVTASFVVRRIGEPRLRTPIMAWPLLIFVWLLALAGEITRDDRRSETPDQRQARVSGVFPDENPFTRPMGRAWAITWTVILFGLYSVGIALIVTRTHP